MLSVFKTLHNHKFHPFKIHLMHELNEDDFDGLLENGGNLTERINNNLR